MRIFSCDRCNNAVFFENVQCLHCGSALAFLPDRLLLASVKPFDDQGTGLWQATEDDSAQSSPQHYRLCQNQLDHQACNFAVAAEDDHAACVSCRQTEIAPNLSIDAHYTSWVKIEAAKRRLYYTLAKLGLAEPHAGLSYQFLADQPGAKPVITGHQNGTITLNIAEADDAERARRRVQLHEPYRTLLGHLRHESGHYFWDRLIRGTDNLMSFREMFGDETQDYASALQRHYSAADATPNWQDNHVSEYATAHPWEDWAETWAHYLHMIDLLETASAYQMNIRVPGQQGRLTTVPDPFGPIFEDFDELVARWLPVTVMLNSLNRSLGQNDAYPFALAPGALAKLGYVHQVIRGFSGHAQAAPPEALPQEA